VSATLRVAIAGAGFGGMYAVGLQAQPEVEVVGVFSRRPERAAEMARRFQIPYHTHRFRELLELPDLDALAIVTPNSTHAEYALAALRAGKHVICDKPLALNSRQGRELLATAERAGVKHITFVPYRFSPAARAMKHTLGTGQLGRLISLRATWGVDLTREPLRWRFQSKLAGPGVVADLGAHLLDLLLWWLPPPRRLLARCQTLVPTRPAEIGGRTLPVDVPDECWALLEFPHQGVGCLSLSWNAQRDQRVEIHGTRASLTYHSPSLLQWLQGRGPFQPTLTMAPAGAPERASQLPLPDDLPFTRPDEALGHIFRHLVAHLTEAPHSDAVATFRDGVNALELIDAIVASDASGAWTDLYLPS